MGSDQAWGWKRGLMEKGREAHSCRRTDRSGAGEQLERMMASGDK